MIYAIQAGTSGPIKLGRAGDSKGRLKDHQVSHYEQLHLLAEQWTANDVKVERALLKRCAAHRIRGEWFRPEGEVLKVVEEIKQAQADQSDPQAWAGRIVEDYRAHMAKYNMLRFLAYMKRLVHAKPVHQG